MDDQSVDEELVENVTDCPGCVSSVAIKFSKRGRQEKAKTTC